MGNSKNKTTAKENCIVQLILQAQDLIKWYDKEKRELAFRDIQDPYKIWLSEIMLQQTKVDTVIPYFQKWIKKYPTIKDVAKAEITDLLISWEGLGYYRRCHNFHKASKIISQEHGGQIPSTWDILIKLPGIGEYTAAAVLSIAFGQKFPVLDGNVKRVMSRFLGIKVLSVNNLKKIKKVLNLSIPAKNPGDFNQSIMELGALICSPRTPKCFKCPISSICKAALSSNPESYPKKTKKGKVPDFTLISCILKKDDLFLIHKRENNMMLGGLWELPNVKVENKLLTKPFIKKALEKELKIKVKNISKSCTVKHSYSHFSVTMHCFNCEISNSEIILDDNYNWILKKDISKYPFSKVHHKIFNSL